MQSASYRQPLLKLGVPPLLHVQMPISRLSAPKHPWSGVPGPSLGLVYDKTLRTRTWEVRIQALPLNTCDLGHIPLSPCVCFLINFMEIIKVYDSQGSHKDELIQCMQNAQHISLFYTEVLASFWGVFRCRHQWEVKVKSILHLCARVCAQPSRHLWGSWLKITFTQDSLPFHKISQSEMDRVNSRVEGLNAQTVNSCISLEFLFSIVLIRMMVSATNNWLAYTILSSQQLINSSVMKLPVVSGSMPTTMMEHLFFLMFSEYFRYIASLSFLSKALSAGTCYLCWMHGKARVSSERLRKLPRANS